MARQLRTAACDRGWQAGNGLEVSLTSTKKTRWYQADDSGTCFYQRLGLVKGMLRNPAERGRGKK
jgi:hypothetical protein